MKKQILLMIGSILCVNLIGLESTTANPHNQSLEVNLNIYQKTKLTSESESTPKEPLNTTLDIFTCALEKQQPLKDKHCPWWCYLGGLSSLEACILANQCPEY